MRLCKEDGMREYVDYNGMNGVILMPTMAMEAVMLAMMVMSRLVPHPMMANMGMPITDMII